MISQNELSKYKVVITDVDGTLYRQRPVRIFMASQILLKDILVVPELLSFRKKREKGLLVEPSERVKKWMYEKPLSVINKWRNSQLLAELNEYKKNGGIVIAYSDYPAKEKLKALGLECDQIYDPESKAFVALKPDSGTLQNILKDYKLSPKECIYIGDRDEKDGLCAKACDVKFHLEKA